MINLKKNALNFITISLYISEIKDRLTINSLNKEHYTNEDKELVIKNIIENNLIADITITKEDGKFHLIDGVKRISAINDFIDGKITYNGTKYNDLNESIKKSFLEYQLSIMLAV